MSLTRLAAAIVVLALGIWPAAADCTCRAGGRDHELGRTVCLQTPAGPRLATCEMALNNTSWRFSTTPCVTADAQPRPLTDSAPAPSSPHPAGG